MPFWTGVPAPAVDVVVVGVVEVVVLVVVVGVVCVAAETKICTLALADPPYVPVHVRVNVAVELKVGVVYEPFASTVVALPLLDKMHDLVSVEVHLSVEVPLFVKIAGVAVREVMAAALGLTATSPLPAVPASLPPPPHEEMERSPIGVAT